MTEQVFLILSIVAVLACVVNGFGILAIIKARDWAKKAMNYFMLFAAGILISMPLMYAIPMAIQKNPLAAIAVFLGFLFLYLSNELIGYHTSKNLKFGIIAVIGIGVHSFIDGIIYSITFSSSIFIGLLVAFGMVLHEFAEGIITYTVLMKSKVKKSKCAFYAFIVAALTTPIGAFVSYPFVSTLPQDVMGLLLGFSAGVILYVGASHLLPEARASGARYGYLAFLAGVALSVGMILTKIL
ncbi:ZIP family metal transporter [Candidatus Micrarchaeota archaeon]|nr:ZIP family metal transporter [Candidatus Micrarchaeota archaeon]